MDQRPLVGCLILIRNRSLTGVENIVLILPQLNETYNAHLPKYAWVEHILALDILSLSAFGCLDWEFMIFEWLAVQGHALEFTITNCFSNATHSLLYVLTYGTHLGNACFNSFLCGSPQWVFSRTLGAIYFWMVKKNMSGFNKFTQLYQQECCNQRLHPIPPKFLEIPDICKWYMTEGWVVLGGLVFVVVVVAQFCKRIPFKGSRTKPSLIGTSRAYIAPRYSFDVNSSLVQERGV